MFLVPALGMKVCVWTLLRGVGRRRMRVDEDQQDQSVIVCLATRLHDDVLAVHDGIADDATQRRTQLSFAYAVKISMAIRL